MSTTDLAPLYALPRLGAEYIREHGWTQGAEQDETGRVCLTGALRLCAPVPGDGLLAREVFRCCGRAEVWNDDDDRTAEEVVAYLAGSEITDDDLADTFGPQWREIVALVRTVSGATPEQIERLLAAGIAARDAVRVDAWDAAEVAAWHAARRVARNAEWHAANVTRDATIFAARFAEGNAARDAASALVVRDLIGQYGFTQEHYDTLMEPWLEVFGEVKAAGS